ncbi:hypothetical protein [Brevundimonas sp.]|uniref:hypothetical protein n=1 Tax=Brevundimonas sp. TaxID=1871086 RepID=UPI003F701507
MAMEAELLADRDDTPAPKERRARAERRGRDRRRDGSRINPDAPRRSLLKPLGAFGVAFSAATFILTLIAGEAAGARATMGIIAFEAAILLTSIILLAMGAIESRLIEIRLELMMLNGGTRGADRRGPDRRDE